MKRTGCILAICVALAASTSAVAQVSTKEPAYSVKGEITLTGKIASVNVIPDWMGKDGVNMAVAGSDSKLLAPHVDVAPAGFLRSYDFHLEAGADVELIGCWSHSMDGSSVFLVHTMKSDRVTLSVRDPRGMPIW